MYQMRSDGTVVTQDVMTGQYIAYRLWQQGQAGMQKSAPLASQSAKATWSSTDRTSGLGIGGLLIGGFAGWLGGALLGTVAGHLISTGRSDVKMSPVIQVK